MRSLPVLLIAFLILALSQISIARALPSPQIETGAIKGLILDPQGAVVVGAAIQATLNQTSEVYTTKSTNDGSFTLSGLPFGDYSLLITAPGFTKFNMQIALSREAAESPHTATLEVAMGLARINVHMTSLGDSSNVCVAAMHIFLTPMPIFR